MIRHIPPLRCIVVATGLAFVLILRPAAAAEALIAVAANFAEPLEKLGRVFGERAGHAVKATSGSTGVHYAQIAAGAPFDVFLSADDVHPRRLETEGRAVPGSSFTYAVGKLALWSADPDRIGADGVAVLRAGGFRRMAIAKPEVAPYGEAAREVLQALGLWATVSDRLVQGQNIAQTFQFVATRNAELGFVALSQVLSPRNARRGSHWVAPQALYRPIRQDAALLEHGRSNAAANEFLAFLRGREAAEIIAAFGYAVGD
jgi:molybdate transport system substrate-binding protein